MTENHCKDCYAHGAVINKLDNATIKLDEAKYERLLLRDEMRGMVSMKLFFWIMGISATIFILIGGGLWKTNEGISQLDKSQGIMQEQLQQVQKTLSKLNEHK
uniref:Uncharacterized protein n=1 Tax=viral metagenome TaxID=1070528 RepID=A0A6M3KKC1_9ZZZZ